ncbi:hypothetical protein [Streptomyces sp. NPDC058424]|uniref:hypothetical protein n=1 Tax=Streptomyces sp. NPDC058424 TaxID=3346491 RepID=UPI00365D5485
MGGVGPRWWADDEPTAVAHVNSRSLRCVEATAHPALEVVSIGVWEGEPLSLEPVVDLLRLRTLRAEPGTLADPLEISRLTGLEFLELCRQDWRVRRLRPRSLAAQRVASEPEPLCGNGALPTRPAKSERHGRLGRGWRSAVRDGTSCVSLVCTVGGDGEQPSAEAGT